MKGERENYIVYSDMWQIWPEVAEEEGQERELIVAKKKTRRGFCQKKKEKSVPLEVHLSLRRRLVQH